MSTSVYDLQRETTSTMAHGVSKMEIYLERQKYTIKKRMLWTASARCFKYKFKSSEVGK